MKSFLRSQGRITRLFCSSNNGKEKYYDVICSGAGIVGQTFSLALSNFSYFKEQDENRILLLDLKEPKPVEKYYVEGLVEKVIPEQRTFSLSHTSVNFLKELGVLDKLENKRFVPYYNMQVWETEGNSFMQFNEEGNGIMGYTIENDHLTSAGYKKITENNKTNKEIGQSGIDLNFGDTITQVEKLPDRGLLRVTFKSGEQAYTKLLVGSDGNRSSVKQLMDIGSWGWSHKQRAIVVTVNTSISSHTLWQRYCEHGPVALLAMWENYYSLIWTVDENTLEYLMDQNEKKFIED